MDRPSISRLLLVSAALVTAAALVACDNKVPNPSGRHMQPLAEEILVELDTDLFRTLIEAVPEDTVLTTAFSVMWPDAPHRVLRSSVEAAEAFEGDVVGEMEHAGQKLPIPRLSVIAPARSATGAVEATAMYAGESVGSVRRVEPAERIVSELARSAERHLLRWT